MKKEYSVQKKKTTANTISRFLFKSLVAIAILIFAYTIIDRTNFQTSSMGTGSFKKEAPNANVPSQLRWVDSFKGIENVPDKKQKKEKEKKNSSGGSSTGFNFQGFGK